MQENYNHKSDELTPVDVGRRLHAITRKRVFSIELREGNKSAFKIEEYPQYSFCAEEETITVKRRRFGRDRCLRARYAQPSGPFIFLRHGELAWKVSKVKALLWRGSLYYPEICLLLLILPLTLLSASGSEANTNYHSSPPPVLEPQKLSSAPTNSPADKPPQSSSQSLVKALAYFTHGKLKAAKRVLQQHKRPSADPQVAQLLAEIDYSHCRQAFDNNRFRAALFSCTSAIRLAPSHDRALRLKQDLLKQAHELFMEAYMLEFTAPKEAKAKYLQVISHLEAVAEESSSNRYLLRAQKRLKDL